MTTTVEGLLADSSKWRAVVKGRAPSNHRVLAELESLLSDEGAGGAISQRIERAWADRRFDVFYDRPLLLIAALRFEALRSGPAHSLFAALGAAEPDPATVTRAALVRALESPSVWDSLATRYVQTNETSRAVAWLWPAALAGCDQGRLLALVEIGASAGLNLVADRLSTPSLGCAPAFGPVSKNGWRDSMPPLRRFAPIRPSS
jgi:hypothetical protein